MQTKATVIHFFVRFTHEKCYENEECAVGALVTGLARALDLVTVNNGLGPTTLVLLVPGIPNLPDSSSRANLAVPPGLQSRFSVIYEGKSEPLELSPRRLEQSVPSRSRNWEIMIRKRDDVELLQSVSSIGFLPVHRVPYNSKPCSPGHCQQTARYSPHILRSYR
jgi:hypothetical protein